MDVTASDQRLQRTDLMNTFRRFLYRLAALLGDVQAVRQGPSSILKRLLRKQVWRATGKLHRRWLP
jgi:hypothetical protein